MKIHLTALALLILGTPITSRAVIGGKLDLSDGAGILQILMTEDGACTATKIGKNLLITAAHCFDDSANLVGFSVKSVNKGMEFTSLSSEKVIIHPSYKALINTDYEESIKVLDIAIVRVKESAEFDLLPTRQFDFSQITPETRLSFYGYGCDKSVNDLENYFPQRKVSETVSLKIETLKSKHGIMTSLYKELSALIYRNSIITPGQRYNSMQASVCYGDSGGPIFKEDKIVGINTLYTFNDINNDGESTSGISYLNLHARVSTAKEWIEQTLKEIGSSH